MKGKEDCHEKIEEKQLWRWRALLCSVPYFPAAAEIKRILPRPLPQRKKC